MQRTLGRSAIGISALGMGCWAIGGPIWRGDQPSGWGSVDDDESIRAIHKALDLGVSFFDTADAYGCGHSERILAKALAGRRHTAVIATKFGNVFDEETKQISSASAEPNYIRSACDASLRRLSTDVIDLYQFHIADYDLNRADEVRATLEDLVDQGKIRYYGWSTDDPQRARHFAQGEHCTAIQQHLNLFGGNDQTLAVCEEEDLASINRGPLGMGILTGKFTKESTVPQDDVRRNFNFKEGVWADQIDALEDLRDILTSHGRTLAQGALAWLWARSPKTIPIPGFKTVQQVEENAGAIQHGPLTPVEMAQIDQILGRKTAKA